MFHLLILLLTKRLRKPLTQRLRHSRHQTAIKKAKADAEKTRTEAQAKADAELIEAKAQAEANKQLSSSITDELIRMKEAEARVKHGWVTINGTSTVVTDKK